MIELYPSIEMMRAVSSGTEACMAALRVARGFTGREAVVKFEGCYHGHADFLLVKAGSGALTFGVPGLGRRSVRRRRRRTITVPYNDVAALEELFEARGTEIAAVIVEPVVGNMGVVPAVAGFLESDHPPLQGARRGLDLRRGHDRLARRSRRHAGARGALRPDMTCLGKIIGGGMPLAAYGGRRAIMEKVAPLGPVYQAGTLSGNPVAVSAALAHRSSASTAPSTRSSNRSGRASKRGSSRSTKKRGVEACVQRVGSMITLFFGSGPDSQLR